MSVGNLLEAMALGVCLGAALLITRIAVRDWKGDRYLCDDCQFNDSQKCHKPERPTAVDCTAYKREPAAM